jgi:hypothetical protein
MTRCAIPRCSVCSSHRALDLALDQLDSARTIALRRRDDVVDHFGEVASKVVEVLGRLHGRPRDAGRRSYSAIR